MSGLTDSFGRPIDYLRISVTDRCNLRCVYCVPPTGIKCRPHSEILSYEEIFQVVEAAAHIGIRKVRLSGGEPLVRLDFLDLVRMIRKINEIDDLALSTNGMLLAKFASELKDAGIKRVNVSLDTMRPERFKDISRRDGLEKVLGGIQAAKDAGMNPVKVNMVVMRGVNDDELVDFARKSIDDAWHVRFIELMPFSGSKVKGAQYMGVPEIKERLLQAGKLEPAEMAGNGPARYYRFPGARGTIGFISPVSEHFCIGCNRLRLTADGKLRLCLLSDEEIDLRPALRSGSRDMLEKTIKEAVARKPRQHRLADGDAPTGRAMTHIGG